MIAVGAPLDSDAPEAEPDEDRDREPDSSESRPKRQSRGQQGTRRTQRLDRALGTRCPLAGGAKLRLGLPSEATLARHGRYWARSRNRGCSEVISGV
jgi:hypothetical protein